MIIDFHSHILPGVDDGSPSCEVSLAMLREAARQGVTHMIATPHFYPNRDNPQDFLQRRQDAFDRLQDALSGETDLPAIHLGAEVYYFNGIADSEITEILTISKTRYMLLEMPWSQWTPQMYRQMEAIHGNYGITPIIAHVDRYIAPMHTHRIPQTLAELPLLVQANANFFIKRHTRPLALRMLKQGQIHCFGSDCHNDQDRPPNLGAALDLIRRNLGEDILNQAITYQNKLFPL